MTDQGYEHWMNGADLMELPESTQEERQHKAELLRERAEAVQLHADLLILEGQVIAVDTPPGAVH